MRIFFTERARRDWRKLAAPARDHLGKKLAFYSAAADPLRFAERLAHRAFGSYRFRVGDYRIIFDVDRDAIVVLRVGHRKDIYR